MEWYQIRWLMRRPLKGEWEIIKTSRREGREEKEDKEDS
jgi:hypothetical protein